MGLIWLALLAVLGLGGAAGGGYYYGKGRAAAATETASAICATSHARRDVGEVLRDLAQANQSTTSLEAALTANRDEIIQQQPAVQAAANRARRSCSGLRPEPERVRDRATGSNLLPIPAQTPGGVAAAGAAAANGGDGAEAAEWGEAVAADIEMCAQRLADYKALQQWAKAASREPIDDRP